MDADDREVRRAAMRRFKRSRLRLRPSTCAEMNEIEEPLQELGCSGGVASPNGDVLSSPSEAYVVVELFARYWCSIIHSWVIFCMLVY